MKKNLIFSVCLTLIAVLVGPGWGARASAPAGPGPIVTVGEELLNLLPKTMTAVIVFNLKRILEIDLIDEAIQDPKIKKAFEEIISTSGVDPKKDVAYLGIAAPASGDAGRLFLPDASSFKNQGIVISLRYDEARLKSLIKEKMPEAREETYNGMTLYSLFGGLDDAPTAPDIPPGLGKTGLRVAFLDASHIALGSDEGVKGIIDAYLKKSEPLAKNPEMRTLIGRVDQSGIAWCVMAYPAELIKQGAASNPQLKALEGVLGMTMAFEDDNSTLSVDVRTLGGSKEQNSALVANLNGLKFLWGMSDSGNPAVAELLKSFVITSGKGYTRATLTASHETLGKLLKLAESKGVGWEALAMEAEDLYHKGDNQGAVEKAKQALAGAEKSLGPDHPDLAAILDNLGFFYMEQAQPQEAEPIFSRSLGIKEKALGADDPAVAEGLSNLAGVYCAQGRLAEAEPLVMRSLAIREKALGPDHQDVAASLGGLAELYRVQNRDAEAENLLKRSLAIIEKTLGPDDPKVGLALDGLADLFYHQRRYAEAEPLLRRLLAIRETALGPDHRDIATTLNILAIIARSQGGYAEAETLFKRALAIREKALGADHPDVATSLHELGLLYHIQGRFGEAETLYKRSLAISEKALGPDNYQVANSLSVLAELYRATKRETEAKELEARAAQIRSVRR
jgi:tetratricopeptide (TPR) repeat protein